MVPRHPLVQSRCTKNSHMQECVNLLRFRLACICDMTQLRGLACIVPVFGLGTWVACFSATKGFGSAVILILVMWLFASALA